MQHEIKQYLANNLRSEGDISTFTTQKPVNKQKKQQAAQQEEILATRQQDKGQVAEIKIADLSQARQLFGPAQEGQEQELISEIEKMVHKNKIQEAVSKIQNDVVWESGKTGEIEKISRLLLSIKESPVIQKHK